MRKNYTIHKKRKYTKKNKIKKSKNKIKYTKNKKKTKTKIKIQTGGEEMMRFRILIESDGEKEVEMNVGTDWNLSQVREIIKGMPDVKNGKLWLFVNPHGGYYDPEDRNPTI